MNVDDGHDMHYLPAHSSCAEGKHTHPIIQRNIFQYFCTKYIPNLINVSVVLTTY